MSYLGGATKSHQLFFAFYSTDHLHELGPIGYFDQLVQKIISFIRGEKYVHVELGDMQNFSYSIVRNNAGVFRERKALKKKGYDFFSISVPQKQYDDTVKFLGEHATKATPFNSWGFLTNFAIPAWLRSPYDAKESAFFCSELLTTALVKAKVLTDPAICPCTTSPDLLFKYLNEKYEIGITYNYGSPKTQTDESSVVIDMEGSGAYTHPMTSRVSSSSRFDFD